MSLAAGPAPMPADTLPTRQAYLEQALDSLNQALIVLDHRRLVVHATPHASGILAQADGLAVRDGVLCASLEADERRLRTHTEMLCRAADPAQCELRIQRLSGKRPYLLRLNPLHVQPEAGTPRGALVIVQDAHANHEAWFDRLTERYGLTPRECECTVLLAQGLGMAEVAERMGIRPQTLRQHLKHAFQKTGSHRQHELVGAALRILRKR